MSALQSSQQADLLHRAAMDAERERLSPEIRVTVICLLKRLLTECLSGAAGVESPDE
jgi:hypothetical protein